MLAHEQAGAQKLREVECTSCHAYIYGLARRAAGLMSVLASIVTPGDADTAALLEPAIQLVAALASDLAAAVEFTAGGGILGLLAILSDSPTKVILPGSNHIAVRITGGTACHAESRVQEQLF